MAVTLLFQTFHSIKGGNRMEKDGLKTFLDMVLETHGFHLL
jgi:hypothetical protein